MEIWKFVITYFIKWDYCLSIFNEIANKLSLKYYLEVIMPMLLPFWNYLSCWITSHSDLTVCNNQIKFINFLNTDWDHETLNYFFIAVMKIFAVISKHDKVEKWENVWLKKFSCQFISKKFTFVYKSHIRSK